VQLRNFAVLQQTIRGLFLVMIKLKNYQHAVSKLVLITSAFLCMCGLASADEERRNYFDDPFLQVTDALAQCPQQEASRITLAEMRAEAHFRAERGTSCYQSGRCRLPNAYLYDKEIIPRVKKAILTNGRFSDTSLWVEGQRRWVWLKGCVRASEQSIAIEQLVRGIDDVESVINELVVLDK